MKLPLKLAVGIVLGLVAGFGVVALGHRPSPFPFLNQYRVIDSMEKDSYVVLTLDADAMAVMKEGYSDHDSKDLIVLLKGGFTYPPVTVSHQLVISENLAVWDNLFLPWDRRSRRPTRYENGRCQIIYRRQPSALDKAWTWLASKFGNRRAYRKRAVHNP